MFAKILVKSTRRCLTTVKRRELALFSSLMQPNQNGTPIHTKSSHHPYEAPIIELSSSVFPGEVIFPVGKSLFGEYCPANTKSIVFVSGLPSSRQTTIGTFSSQTGRVGGSPFCGERRVEVLAYRRVEHQMLALVKNIDSAALTSTFCKDYVEPIPLEHYSWATADVVWCTTESNEEVETEVEAATSSSASSSSSTLNRSTFTSTTTSTCTTSTSSSCTSTSSSSTIGSSTSSSSTISSSTISSSTISSSTFNSSTSSSNVSRLRAAETLCEGLYKDLSTCLRMYRAFKWANIRPATSISPTCWRDMYLVKVLPIGREVQQERCAPYLRDLSGKTQLSAQVCSTAPCKRFEKGYKQVQAKVQELQKIESCENPLFIPIGQTLHQQVMDGFTKRRKFVQLYFSNYYGRVREQKLIQLEKLRAAEDLLSPSRALQAEEHFHVQHPGHLSAAVSSDHLSIDPGGTTRTADVSVSTHRAEIFRLCAQQDAFSYAVAAQLKSLGAGITTARLQQYLEAPTTLARLTLLAADLAHIKEQLAQDALARGVLTAEQLQQLEEVDIGDTWDLDPVDGNRVIKKKLSILVNTKSYL